MELYLGNCHWTSWFHRLDDWKYLFSHPFDGNILWTFKIGLEIDNVKILNVEVEDIGELLV